MPEEIIWEEPPPTALGAGQKPGRYREFAEQLQQHPGRWAVLPGEKKSEASARATAQNIRGGRVGGMAKGQYETAVAGTKIYVRFSGTAQRATEPLPDDAEDEGDSEAGPQSQRRRSARSESDAPQVRAWAKANGYLVPERGRLSSAVYEAYYAAQAGASE